MVKVSRKANRRVEVFAILLIALSVLTLLSLLTYNPVEEPTVSEQIALTNIMGIVGVYVSHYLIKFTLGYAAIVFPVLGMAWGIGFLLRREHKPLWRITWYGLLLALLSSVAVGLPEAPLVFEGRGDFTAAGMIGGVCAKVLHDFLGIFGSVFILLAGYFLVISGYLRWDVRAFLARQAGKFEVWFAEWRDRRRRGKTMVQPRSYARKRIKSKSRATPKSTSRQRKSKATADTRGRESVRVMKEQRTRAAAEGEIPIDEQKAIEAGDIDAMEERQTRWRQYRFPPLDLLAEPPAVEEAESRAELLDKARELERALATFKVEGRVVNISPGPVITLFEVEPGEGVRVNKFTVLADDLARIMSAERIRIIAPIAGTKHVGVEIPNRRPAIVYLNSIISSDEYVSSRSPLTVALGKTTSGEAYCFDLAQMPHLLIAGTTGSGKSVCINTIITSYLYRVKPDEVRFILIDPKKLELSSYRALEGYHLITTPGIGEYVLTTPKSAVAALRSVLREMERRYALFSEATVRNIEEYRAKASKRPELETVPYLVIIIDELSDLMVTSGKDVEEPITRLAQMSRAVGIHLVIATQRPSVDVITGLIKANFPARIAFQVATKVDSRTILDQMGAEKLLGRGDLLFLPPGASEPVRLHAAYISLNEITDILDFIQKQPKPDEIFLPDEVEEREDGEITIAGEDDDLIEEAARLVISQRQASVSMLQRRFRIGYSRAGRLIDELERAGVISGYSGSKARDVLVDESYLEELRAKRNAA
ncbi:MAG: DNA translocase FtsK 4TM domain-containing protein [Fidelibacterota bacterium]|nr:MAG: DNA translocase FtsK 4TM domain-containing protein [Candidatus Neomarinimicrobiota bacterium]